MIEKFAEGLRHQITVLKEKLKKHNPARNPKVYKEILDALETAEKRYSAERAKREEKKKQKAQEAVEKTHNIYKEIPEGNRHDPEEKEAAPKVEDGNVVMPKKEFVEEHEKLVKELEPMVEEHKEQGAELKEVKEASPKCAVCAVEFKSYPEYQKHQEEAHGKREYVPMDPSKKREIVKDVEQKLGPAIISTEEPKAELYKFSVDDKVEPIRGGTGSWGHVMRPAGVNNDPLVYVRWMEGPIKEKHGEYGGYYEHDLKKKEEPKLPQPPHNPGPEHICPECAPWHNVESGLKENYHSLLADLKKELADEMVLGQDMAWIHRLEGKIKDLEQKIAERFPEQKEAGAQNNSEGLVVMDHTPPRANVTKDEGGKDSTDEYQDQWANPDGRDLESAKGAPLSLFNTETAPVVVERLKTEIKAPYVFAQVAALGGPDEVSIIFTISADPKESWSNNILENSRYGKFYLHNDGELEQFSGAFAPKPQSTRYLRKRNVKSVDQLIQVLNTFLDQINAAPKTASLKKDAIMVNVFKRDWEVVPEWKEGGVRSGYTVYDDAGRKVMHLVPQDGKQMTKEMLEWAISQELTRGLKQAKLVEKIAFLDAGTKVYILATDKAKKRVKFASLEQGVRGWVPESKIEIIALESQTARHGEHSDKVLGQTATETLLDCIEGGPIWVNSTELLDANRPPATPESLSLELEEAKKEKCPGCGKEAFLSYRRELQRKMCEECYKLTEDRTKWLKEPEGRPYPKQSAKRCYICGKESKEDLCSSCKRIKEVSESNRPAGYDKPAIKESTVHCPKCNSEDTGSDFKTEGKHFCHRCGHEWMVENKEALRTQLPSLLPDQRGHVSAEVEKKADEEVLSAEGLDMYANNTRELYPFKLENIDLIKKMLARNSYAANLMVEWWERWFRNAAIMYKKEFPEDAQPTQETIHQAAVEIEPYELEKVKNGEYDPVTTTEPTKDIDLEKLPVIDLEKAKDDLLDQLVKETDPEKKKSLERRYKHLTMASLNKVATVADFIDKFKLWWDSLLHSVNAPSWPSDAELESWRSTYDYWERETTDPHYIKELQEIGLILDDFNKMKTGKPGERSNVFMEKYKSPLHKPKHPREELFPIPEEAIEENKLHEGPEKEFDINKLPVANEEEEKSKIIDLLNKETDPEKRKKLQQRYKHISMGSLKIASGECSAYHVTWGPNGFQCLNCGAEGEHSWDIKHDPNKNPQLKASLNKVARVVHQEDGWHVLSEKGKNLGGPYKTKGQAVKRLRQVEYFKHHGSQRPFSKKAEVLTDPYQSLMDQVSSMRERMNAVQQRLESNPLPKQADVDITKGDMSPCEILEDIEMGLALLENKIVDNEIDGEINSAIEEMEHLLESVEKVVGPEEGRFVDKEAQVPATPNPAMGTPVPPTPAARPNQPTDEDNLEISVVKPTSPPAPGQIWVFDTEGNKYVSMPDPNIASGKTI